MMDSTTTRARYSRHTGDYSTIPNDLVRLEELDEYEISDEEPDPRGWDLVGTGGEKLGTIDELLVSPSTLKAYFAIVKCGGWFDSKRFVVPLANINFNHEDKVAYAPFVRESFRSAPAYQEGTLLDYNGYYTYWNGVGRT